MNQPPVVTIDGPSGSGKGTISQLLAEELGWHLLDSGALYRVLAFAAQKRGVANDQTEALALLAEYLDVQFSVVMPGNPVCVVLEGEDVSDAIRTEKMANEASKVAAIPEVRKALLERQRVFREYPGLVADGRDMGTTVFPDADVKIFLFASPEARAKRRHRQLLDKGINVKLADLINEVVGRDKRDQERKSSPLRPADDAVLIDTTDLSIDEVMIRVRAAVQQINKD